MSEIKFVQENQDLLVAKIDELQNKLTVIVGDFTEDMRITVRDFNDKVNKKLKGIEARFLTIQEENEELKKQVSQNKFEESNFNKVSIQIQLAKQITEKDLKIKELESRIRYLESANTNTTTTKLVESVSAPVSIPDEGNHNANPVEPEPIKPKTTKIIKKVNKVIPIAIELDSENNISSGNNHQNDQNDVGNPLEMEIKKLDTKPDTKPDTKMDKKPSAPRAKISTRRKIEIAVEVEPESKPAEPVEVVESKVKITKKPKEIKEPKEVKSSAKKVAEIKNIVKSVEEEPPAPEPVPELNLVSEQEPTAVVIEPNEQSINEPPQPDITTSEVSTNAGSKRVINYPDDIPNDNQIDMIEVMGKDYYKDTRNDNVYLICPDESIGAFIGVLDAGTILFIDN